MPLPTGKHTDWPFPFSYIPRRWTSFEYHPPRKWWGNAKSILIEWRGQQYWYSKPIPDRGEWWIGYPLYAASTSKRGWHIRFGIRFDDVDFYYNWPTFTIKRVN